MTPADHTPYEGPNPRGAPMGRRLRPHSVAMGRDAWEEDLNPARALTQRERELAYSGHVYLRRIRLDSGGYDAGGAYWGWGAPLYSAMTDCGTVDLIFRARSREIAKATVRETAPRARFYG